MRVQSALTKWQRAACNGDGWSHGLEGEGGGVVGVVTHEVMTNKSCKIQLERAEWERVCELFG